MTMETLALVSLIGLWTIAADEGTDVIESSRSKRIFSLFNVVTFKNDDCTASSGSFSGKTGICYSSTECSEKGGTASGNCAVGFGRCCIISVSSATTITENGTYISNSGYPSTVSGASDTSYSLCPSNSQDICAIRLDFCDFDIPAQTAGVVSSSTARLKVDGPTSNDPPLVNEDLTGQHMYVETGRSCPTTVQLVTLAATSSAKWRIRTTFIECSCPNLPDQGCTQWFTGDTGTICTYGYGDGTGQELAQQDQTMCIRKNANKCTITYTPKSSTSFIVGATTANAETTTCAIAAIYIPNSQPSGAFTGMVCHEDFNPTDDATSDGAITQSCPFRISHRSIAQTTAKTSVTGAKLNYVQGGC